MSSLWTPGGEHPVDRPISGSPSADIPAPDPALDDEIAAALPDGITLDELTPEERARAEEMVREMTEARSRLLETPASMIVANHGMGLYELAALHLAWQGAYARLAAADGPLRWHEHFALARNRLAEATSRSGCRVDQHRD